MTYADYNKAHDLQTKININDNICNILASPAVERGDCPVYISKNDGCKIELSVEWISKIATIASEWNEELEKEFQEI